tara:strand:- start:2565 stop:3725 length:1161 start_codon:yes stop_codon:yes gene_type:complete
MVDIDYVNANYPHVPDLKRRAKARMPRFAFDYLEEGCMEEHGVARNYRAIDEVLLQGSLLKPFDKSDLSVELFGHTYAAPFGIAPVGLQGLMWPRAPEILAKAAADKNIPYVLSTVSSASLESIAEISEGKAWFQFYNPTSDDIRSELLERVKQAGYPVLVVTVDVPTFGYRPRDIRNGLAMPPKMSLSNILQMAACPRWLIETALAGEPQMQTLKPYMAKDSKTEELAEFMNRTVMGPVDAEGLKSIRDTWKGPLVIKGLITEEDVAAAIELGADGVIISNHGARQLDASQSPVVPLQRISAKFKDKIKIFMDSGLQSGTNIASAIACGAEFTFLGRPFVYGVGALGKKGGYHTINCLYRQLDQVMNQLRCKSVSDLPNHLVPKD